MLVFIPSDSPTLTLPSLFSQAEERRGATLESGLIHPFFGPKRAIGATPDTDAGSGSTLYSMPGKAKTPDMMQALLALQSTTMMLQQQQQQQHQQQPTQQQQQQQHPQPSLGGAPPSEPVSEELVQFAAQHHLEPATAMTVSKHGISLHDSHAYSDLNEDMEDTKKMWADLGGNQVN